MKEKNTSADRPRVSSILFDMDGVIVDSMKLHAEAWLSVLRQYGVPMDALDIYKREGMSGKDSVIDIYREKNIPFPGDEIYSEMISKKLAFFEQGRVGLFPHVDEMLGFLRGKGISLALVTGSLRRSVENVLPKRIMEFFRAIVTADDVQNGKPHPEPYLTALGKLGAGPDETLVIENAPQGIRAAVDAGLECYALETTLPEEYLWEASRIFKNHASLLQYFRDQMD